MEDFEKIYSEYFDVVYHYVLSLCLNESLAEEITQEAFFKALKNIDSFRGDCKVNVWLCRIAKNIYYTESKRKAKIVDYPLELIPSEESIENDLLVKESAMEIHRLLHKLEEPYKEVFWMRTFGELSFKDIAAVFSKTESWARVTYHRARMKIREDIK